MQQRNTKMQHRRPAPVFASLLGLGLLSLLPPSILIGQATPAKPASTRPATDPADLRIQQEQARVARDPDFYASYNRLAAAYAQKARETGDITYFELAETALRQSLKLESTHDESVSAWTQIATVHLAMHKFQEAGEDTEKAIALDPRNLIAYPYAGDAQLELGNYDNAEKFYAHLIIRTDATSGPDSDSRPHPGADFLLASHGAGLHWIEGKTTIAADDLKHAIDLARQLRLPPENIAWTEFMLGEQYFQSGDPTNAEKYVTASLVDFPRYHRSLSAMGQLRAAQGRFPEAIDFYKHAIAIIPLPLYIAALGDIYTISGDPADAKKQFALVEYIGKLSAINQQVYNRELALFYADHDMKPADALALAQKELEVRHDVYTSDALAWALLKNGKTTEARAAIEQAMRLGTQDALMEFHAGMIYNALSDPTKASAHLRRALAINPHFHVLFAVDAAKTLAQLDSHPTGATPTR